MAAHIEPRAFTSAALAVVLEQVRRGAFLGNACRTAGVDPGTLRYWRRKFEAGERLPVPLEAFFRTLAAAEAAIEHDLLRKVLAGDETWRAAAWMLERRFPTRWGSGKRRARSEAGDPGARRRVVAEARRRAEGRKEAPTTAAETDDMRARG